MITPAEIEESLLLTKDNSPRFQLLIVADHYAESYSRINNKLGNETIEKIKEYVNHGGQIHAYGKSGYLLESWGLLQNGMYDTSTLMASTNSILEEKIDGCNNINSDSNNDFWKSLLCMNFDSYDGYGKSFLLSAYKVNSDKTSGVKTLLSYDSASATLRFKNLDGLMSELSSTDKDFLPFIMEATHESGKIMLINGNPLFKNTYNEIFYNLLFMPMSRSVAFDYYLGTKDNNPIPGGEAGILLKFSLSFINVYNKDINGLKTHIWLPDNIGFVEPLPENCEITPYENPTFEKDLTLANASCHVQCATDSLSAFNKFEKIITIEILHSNATQAKYDIPIVFPAFEYIDIESSHTYRADLGCLKTDAAMAALLRGALNPDPSSFYPIKGRGQYVDNVLQVENKEDTEALDVDYIAMIPLISPVVDGSDQTEPIRALRFLPSYYVQYNETKNRCTVL